MRTLEPFEYLPEQEFSWGWCTWFVAKRRSEIGRPVTWRGDARDWFEEAKNQGWVVGAEPAVGSIYVTRAENSRGTRSGHVAIVIDVRENGIVIEESNFIGFGVISTRWVSKEKLESDKVGFIL